MMRTRAVILAGGEGRRLGTLTSKRAKPAVPFAGKYRLIDFTLSNCSNSNISDVIVLAQYHPHSLIDHVRTGGPWDLNRESQAGVRVLTPFKTRSDSNWYTGTADAVQQNIDFIKRDHPDLILVLSGDHIYKMDYTKLIQFHLEHQAEVTIAATRVPINQARCFGILEIDDALRVRSFVEKPILPPSNLANMGVYLFNADLLDHAIREDNMKTASSHDFGKDILPDLIQSGTSAFAYPFQNYWMDVGTIDSYWQAHMDLLNQPFLLDLNDRSWVIHTRTEERPPVKIEKGATIHDSLICDGCVIQSGAVIEHSVLSPGVVVKAGSVINESVLLTDTTIGNGVFIRRAIIDKKVIIGENAKIGSIENNAPTIFPIVGKNSHIPAWTIIDPGGMIGTDVFEDDFITKHITSDLFIEKENFLEFRNAEMSATYARG
jgi:glucose-1-phosphate adenylyltransferase